jgi:hypothetical protein
MSARWAWLTAAVRRRLAWSVAASLVLPWVIGELAKAGMQPGFHPDAERAQMLVDFIVAGACLFGLTMVLTWLIGVWVVAVMRGPRVEGDPFPGATAGEPLP